MVTTDVPSVSGVFRGFPRPAPGRPGDPGLFGPGSMVWRVNGETAMLLGSGRALLMQIAHPMVAAGVADHSDFEAGAFDRLWRTLDAVLTVAFGDTEQALAAADHVTGIHRRVAGSRGGRPYSALDPDLLLWVHATLVDTALVTYRRFVGPLAPADQERYYQEMKRFGGAFGVPQDILPRDLAGFRRYVQEAVATLEVTCAKGPTRRGGGRYAGRHSSSATPSHRPKPTIGRSSPLPGKVGPELLGQELRAIGRYST